jgi:hypothetical protein
MKQKNWLSICKYLDSEDIIKLKNLCRNNNEFFSSEKTIWSRLIFNKKKININYFSKYNNSPKILSLRYCKVSLNKELFNFNKLEYVDFYGTSNIDSIIVDIIKTGKLKHLNLKWIKFKTSQIFTSRIYLLTILQNNTLEYLNLSSQKKYMKNISMDSNLYSLKKLKYLNLNNVIITNALFIRLLMSLEDLKELVLSHVQSIRSCLCSLKKEPLNLLISKIQNLKSLRYNRNTFCKCFPNILSIHCKDCLIIN